MLFGSRRPHRRPPSPGVIQNAQEKRLRKDEKRLRDKERGGYRQ